MEYDLAGRLRHFTLSDLIQLMSFSGQTGTLTLSQGWNVRTITFEEGRLTYIAAATKLSSVEELLLKADRITEHQLSEAVALAEATSQRTADVLLAKRIVDLQDIRRCLDQQLEETIYSLFLWRNCEFVFESGIVRKLDGFHIDIAGERLVMEGTRRVDEWITISPVIPSVRMIFRVVGRAGLEQRAREEQHIYRYVDGVRDVAAIAKAAGLTQFETATALYQLVRAGLVRAMPPDKPRIVDLFKFLVESIYMKLLMYGYSRVAFEFQNQLNKFALDNNLKTRMARGKLTMTDLDLNIETTGLIDMYKLFIAIENNKFTKMFPSEVIHGLVEGLYLHVDAQFQDMMRMYDFYEIEGLLKASRQPLPQTLRPGGG